MVYGKYKEEFGAKIKGRGRSSEEEKS